jgi:hypothetical protein
MRADQHDTSFPQLHPGCRKFSRPNPRATPRINGPKIFGVRPGSPFLYSIPATGDRPMTFSADGLPDGLQLDPANGHITGAPNAGRIQSHVARKKFPRRGGKTFSHRRRRGH